MPCHPLIAPKNTALCKLVPGYQEKTGQNGLKVPRAASIEVRRIYGAHRPSWPCVTAPLVPLHVTPYAERLAAPRMRALERLLACM